MNGRGRSDVPRAVVLGLDTMQGLQTARILARRGVPVIGIVSDGSHHARRTNVCERVLVAPRREDLMRELAALGRSLSARAILFPCLDGKVLTVSRAREELSQWYRIVLPPADVVEMLMDKSAFYRHAQDSGLPIPPTYVLGPDAGLDEVPDTIRYPVVLKPAFRTSQWTANTTEKAFK
ncbi:MAG: hypothetical protein R3324_20910, partial [Halobacteriales archaeon]|nr:hypothetical protein [Halobacteriales archaeon]